jgi:hypothetical protein
MIYKHSSKISKIMTKLIAKGGDPAIASNAFSHLKKYPSKLYDLHHELLQVICHFHLKYLSGVTFARNENATVPSCQPISVNQQLVCCAIMDKCLAHTSSGREYLCFDMENYHGNTQKNNQIKKDKDGEYDGCDESKDWVFIQIFH